jgi:hypothetical protein
LEEKVSKNKIDNVRKLVAPFIKNNKITAFPLENK